MMRRKLLAWTLACLAVILAFARQDRSEEACEMKVSTSMPGVVSRGFATIPPDVV